jgi:nucleoid-associated protein YgaU
MINNYQKMKNIKNSLEQVKEDTLLEEDEDIIEVIGGEIENEFPQEDEKEEEKEVIDEPQESTEEAYIVQKGDTLESICVKKYGDNSRIKEICQVNGLEDGNLIFVGQKLLLP